MKYTFKPSKVHAPHGTDLMLGDKRVGGYWTSQQVCTENMVYCYLTYEYPGFYCENEGQARSVLVRLARGTK
jgi:hypothetical protein